MSLRIRPRRADLLLLASSVVLSLGVAEIGIRLLRPEWSDQWKMWRIDPVYARGLRPDVRNAVVHGHSGEFAFRFSTNAQGLRMDHDLAPAPSGRPRILIVGDSFAFGYGVDQAQTFADQMQRRLAAEPHPFEVINAGFASGFTLDTEYLFTRQVGVTWRPRIVVVSVCLSNDLADLAETHWRVSGGELAGLAKQNDWVPLWVKQSGLVNLLVKGALPRLRTWWSTREGPGDPLAPVSAGVPGVEMRPVCELPVPRPGSGRGGPLAESVPRLEEAGALASSPAERVDWILRAWARHARTHDYELVLLLVPDASEVQWISSPALLAQHAATRAVFATAAQHAGVEVVDPVAEMRAHWCETGEALYFEGDGHWNAAGHRFIGDWLSGVLPPPRGGAG